MSSLSDQLARLHSGLAGSACPGTCRGTLDVRTHGTGRLLGISGPDRLIDADVLGNIDPHQIVKRIAAARDVDGLTDLFADK